MSTVAFARPPAEGLRRFADVFFPLAMPSVFRALENATLSDPELIQGGWRLGSRRKIPTQKTSRYGES